MMHEQTMQGHLNDTNFSRNPSPGSGNRNTDVQDSGERGFFNEWDGGGAGGSQGHSSEGASNDGALGAKSHAGRGPKGYERADARIAEDVHRILTDDHELDASEIEVIVSAGEVTLSGSVQSRQARRRAEELLDDIVGLKEVHNRLKANTNQDVGA